MSIYADDGAVERITRDVLAAGHSIFQIFKLADGEPDHARMLLRHFRPAVGAHVVDLGCGVGSVAKLMSEARPDLRFTLVNISPSQLALCPPGFPKIAANLEAVPQPDGAFDAAMLLYSLGHADLDKALRECARLLAPGGVLLIYDIWVDAERDQQRIAGELDYIAHFPRQIAHAATRHGFKESMALYSLVADARDFRELVGADYCRRMLEGVSPLLLRLVRL